jgi:hypothetical protein
MQNIDKSMQNIDQSSDNQIKVDVGIIKLVILAIVIDITFYSCFWLFSRWF